MDAIRTFFRGYKLPRRQVYRMPDLEGNADYRRSSAYYDYQLASIPNSNTVLTFDQETLGHDLTTSSWSSKPVSSQQDKYGYAIYHRASHENDAATFGTGTDSVVVGDLMPCFGMNTNPRQNTSMMQHSTTELHTSRGIHHPSHISGGGNGQRTMSGLARKPSSSAGSENALEQQRTLSAHGRRDNRGGFHATGDSGATRVGPSHSPHRTTLCPPTQKKREGDGEWMYRLDELEEEYGNVGIGQVKY